MTANVKDLLKEILLILQCDDAIAQRAARWGIRQIIKSTRTDIKSFPLQSRSNVVQALQSIADASEIAANLDDR